MNNSEETLEQSTLENENAVLKAIADLSSKIDRYKKESDLQFEAIRQGLVSNSAAFDRLESVVYTVRSDISALKADVKELGEEVHQLSKEKTLELK